MPTIKELRHKIDKIDADIIKKLSQRNALAIKIGKLKSSAKTEVFDEKREGQLMQRYENLSIQYQLRPSFIKRLFKSIIVNSRRVQKN